jgi:aspartyl-tRNA(Asn)/glutamyl-tRNA(Gln) amidotransferase subunit B
VLVGEPRATELFEGVLAAGKDGVEPKSAANWVSGSWLGLLKSDPEAAARVDAAELADLIGRIARGELSGTNAKEVFAEHATTGDSVATIVEAKGFRQISDSGAIGAVIDEVIAANPKAVEDYRAGKPVAGFFVGQVMKATRGQANAAVVQDAVKAKLDEVVRG